MPLPLKQRARRTGRRPQAVAAMERWKLEDAKARLSEVVRLAATEGPQLVTIRGREAAVILAPEEYAQLLPKPEGHVPLVQFLRRLGLDRLGRGRLGRGRLGLDRLGRGRLGLDKLDIEREIDRGREIAL